MIWPHAEAVLYQGAVQQFQMTLQVGDTLMAILLLKCHSCGGGKGD
jgi:hypothetical protein